MLHKLLSELPWGAPAHVLGMTLPQFFALCDERPPGRRALESAEDLEEFLRKRAAAEAAWSK